MDTFTCLNDTFLKKSNFVSDDLQLKPAGRIDRIETKTIKAMETGRIDVRICGGDDCSDRPQYDICPAF